MVTLPNTSISTLVKKSSHRRVLDWNNMQNYLMYTGFVLSNPILRSMSPTISVISLVFRSYAVIREKPSSLSASTLRFSFLNSFRHKWDKTLHQSLYSLFQHVCFCQSKGVPYKRPRKKCHGRLWPHLLKHSGQSHQAPKYPQIKLLFAVMQTKKNNAYDMGIKMYDRYPFPIHLV